MSEVIQGGDWSHWQGVVNAPRFKQAGGRFAYIKISQGINYADDRALVNAQAAKAQGLPIGPYHFGTTDAPGTQYSWFMQCLANIGIVWDLAPAVDYEYYTPVDRGEEIIPHLAFRDVPPAKYLQFLEHTNRWSAAATQAEVAEYSLVIPAAATLYTLLSKLKGWSGHPAPLLYTNPSSANANLVNSATYNWRQFLPWPANWNVPTPNMPAIWKGLPYCVWQDKVIQDASAWGVDGAMDHDVWGEALPFPSAPVPSNEIELNFPVTAPASMAGIYKGKLTKE